MKKNILIWSAAAVLVVIAVIVTSRDRLINSANQPATASTLSQTNIDLIDTGARQKAVDFTLNDLNGNNVSLKDLRGKNVYINFWATWCPWCKKELPDLEKVSQEYKDKNLVVLAIDIGEDKATVGNYMKENNYDFNVLLDGNSNTSQQYGVSSIPVSIFIDKKGNIAKKDVGAMTEGQMKSIIDKLLKE